jgi:hypothetical protein
MSNDSLETELADSDAWSGPFRLRLLFQRHNACLASVVCDSDVLEIQYRRTVLCHHFVRTDNELILQFFQLASCLLPKVLCAILDFIPCLYLKVQWWVASSIDASLLHDLN